MIRSMLFPACLIAVVPPVLAQGVPGVASANRAATREPASSAYLNAVQVYPYADGALYRLYTAPGRVSDIALQPGEALVAVAAGDTARWTVGDTTSGTGEGRRTHLLVKPFAAGLSTNLVITTDRRVYHVQLTSVAAAAMTAIRWTYPADTLLAMKRIRDGAEAARPVSSAVDITALDFRYAISGDKPDWRPLRAFDDGRQTWIEFPHNLAAGEAPPLFVLGEQGEAELVNYRVAGRYYIVDRLFAAAELRIGGKRQLAVRISRHGSPVQTKGKLK